VRKWVSGFEKMGKSNEGEYFIMDIRWKEIYGIKRE